MPKPYPFQQHVTELLLSGENVILQAPTGAGKTRAALLPLLHSVDHSEIGFPQKCIYAVPMRVLANQFLTSWREIILKGGRSEKLPVSILTGEQRDDTRFEARLTFATIDQVLSSYLLTPYSLSHRQANLNAGAVVASYLVFDEFHLFNPTSTLPTTLEMLHQLKGITPFLLMTATFSETMLKKLAERLCAVIVPGNQAERDELQAIESQQKTRRFHAVNAPLSAEAVVEHHRQAAERTLVVCNTVDRARALYEDVKSRHENTLLLHSRFLPPDRREREEMIRSVFAKGGPRDTDMIVISTQAIEVGLDITCRTLITELAPANAVIQRAGRCARNKGEEGDVYVYNQTHDARDREVIDLRERVNPYAGLEHEFAETWGALQEHSGKVYDFRIEQEMISRVHGPRDREIIAGIGVTKEQHRSEMHAVMRGDSGGASRLIREIASYRVVIHSDWQAVKMALEDRLAVETFSLSREVLYGALDSLLDRANSLEDGIEPLVALYEIRDARQSRDNDEANQTGYEHRFVSTKNDIAGAALLVINPALATYSPELGLLLDTPGNWECPISQAAKSADRQSEGYSYRLESYQDHVQRVWQAFEQVAWPEAAGAAARMEGVFGWPEGSLCHAAALAVLLHDVGKLSVGWQKWAHAWQKAVGNHLSGDAMAAHTDYNSADPEQRERARGFSPRRPPHAGEGAYACLPLLARALGKHEALVPATFTAILRHHTPFAEDNQDYQLVAAAPAVITETLAGLLGTQMPGLLMKPQPGGGADQFVTQPEEDNRAFLAYLLLVRVLRRADQIGTEWGTNM